MFLEKLKKYIKYKKMWHKIEKIKKISKYETKDGIQSRNYLTKDSYKTYLEHQKSKFAFYSKDLADQFDDQVKDFKQHFQKVNIGGEEEYYMFGFQNWSRSQGTQGARTYGDRNRYCLSRKISIHFLWRFS